MTLVRELIQLSMAFKSKREAEAIRVADICAPKLIKKLPSLLREAAKKGDTVCEIVLSTYVIYGPLGIHAGDDLAEKLVGGRVIEWCEKEGLRTKASWAEPNVFSPRIHYYLTISWQG